MYIAQKKVDSRGGGGLAMVLWLNLAFNHQYILLGWWFLCS